MMEIIPAILPKNYEELKNKVAQVRDIVSLVQLDICDGQFVPTKTWPYDEMGETGSHFQMILREEEGLPYWEEMDYELDLMIVNPAEHFDLFLKLGARRIIFHLESIDNIDEFREFLEGIDPYIRDTTKFGLAINVATPISNLDSLIHNVDFVQCMGIEKIGYQGEPFDERVLGQIKSLREKYPDLAISVDGGVSLENVSLLKEAGTDRLVVGSAIFKSFDVADAINELANI